MRRKIPPSEWLTAFESVSHHLNFSRTAEELALTPSAISRQIASLEEYLGVDLLVRSTRQVHLTAAGEVYAKQVASLLNKLEHDTLALMAHRGSGGVLELATIPTFATKWLIPKLPRFQHKHPEITLDLTTRAEPFLFMDSNFDAAIHFGAPNWPGASTEYLFGERTITVCAPSLLKRKSNLSLDEMARLPLLHLSTRPDGWRDWFSSAGAINVNPMGGPRYELFSMLVEAAKTGMGLALVPRFFVLDELQSGALVSPHKHTLLNQGSYYLVLPDGQEESMALAVFRAWLHQEATDYRAALPPYQTT